MKMRRLLYFVVFFSLLFGRDAVAHIKWFAPYDLSVMPYPPTMVVAEPWWQFGVFASIFLVYSIILAERRGYFAFFARMLRNNIVFNQAKSDRFVSITTAVWMSWLWLLPQPVYLTPETKSGIYDVQVIQLAIAAFCLFPKYCMVASAGITLLWLGAVKEFGLFHMMDYPIFIGLAIHLFFISAHYLHFRIFYNILEKRNLILIISLSMTLAWGAIEKWSYPSWTIPMLEDRRYLLFGLPSSIFLNMAGWVEWVAAFVLVAGAKTARKTAAAFLFVVMSAAVIDFGRMDLVGHFPMLAGLVIAFASSHSNPVDTYVSGKNPSRLFLLTPVMLNLSAIAAYVGVYFLCWNFGYGDIYCFGWNEDAIFFRSRDGVFTFALLIFSASILVVLRMLNPAWGISARRSPSFQAPVKLSRSITSPVGKARLRLCWIAPGTDSKRNEKSPLHAPRVASPRA